MSTHTAPDGTSVRIVQPPNRLKSKVGRGSPTLPPTVPPTFRALVHASAAAYSRHLDDQLHALRALSTGGGAAAAETIFAIAHQIRGEARTFGFGHVGNTAESLCAFIEAGGPERARGGAVVTLHVDTMVALKADGGDSGAQALLDGLARAVRHVLSPERA
ncbi:Hpt domain-containing protein [Azospirillum sp.]|uniref:Hpt domain-containing protein n=1 Tax=Azospirillum sp. TaxID=34012 RepID=UPI003D72AF4D